MKATSDAPVPPAAAPAGDLERVGSYQLVRRIGSGAMGEVWLGRHVISGGLGAIKRLSPTCIHGGLVTYFAREGRAVARLDHPHVVPIFEAGHDYLISAFIDGGTLTRRLYTPMEPAEALRLGRQIADALAHAHDRGIIHRDVKPSNILVDSHDNAFLADFGLAAFIGESDDPARSGGTPLFMAPEQRRGQAIGPAVDQYALGRTLLEMLIGTGVPLDRVAALAELPSYLPASLRVAIERATAHDPDDRFPSMTAFAAALAAVELGDIGPPRRLSVVVRDAVPFAWLTGARTVVEVGPDLQRADYRLSELAAAGLIMADRVTGFLGRTGLADMGFSVWTSTPRLGTATDPLSLARASDIVVLLHGWGGTRAGWGSIAGAICRDNARAVVLTPDLHGFGESPFAGVPTVDQAGAIGLARAVDEWRRLLGLVAIPTALVGYSMSGLAVLAIDDNNAGQYVSRVAINPILVNHNPALRVRFRRIWLAAVTVGRFEPLRRLFIRRGISKDPEARRMTEDGQAAVLEQLLKMPGPVMAQIIRGLAATPAHMGRHRRAAVIVSLDDPWMNFATLDDMIAEVGIEPAMVHRLASGGHNPHASSETHPEWVARNRDDIVRIIDGMLITAAEPDASTSSADGTTVTDASSLLE